MSDQKLIPVAREHEKAHRAFLLWMMQDPGKRSIRAAAHAVGYSDAMLRKWAVLHKWAEREMAIGAGADALAARYYSTHYHHVRKGKEVDQFVQGRMAIQYLGPDASAPGLASGPPLAVPVPMSSKSRAIELHGDIHEDRVVKRKKQLHMVLDAAVVRIQESITKNKMRYSVSDLVTVTKLRRELEAGSMGAQTSNPMATSIRVEKAAAEGGDILAALAEDHDELGLILATLATATEASNVLPFPGRVEIKEAQG